ncbi:MAG TPA: hypothetical protein VK791_08875 [bacterium]|jgi:hypothetical protein|nr:hypothetical protein [bacterium]
MALTIKTNLRNEYLYALIEGEFEYLSSIETTDAILEACARHQATKVLVDYRTVAGAMNDNERIHYAQISVEKYQKLFAKGVVKKCRFVWLGKQPLVDPKRLGESVALNMGLTIRVTQSLDDAFIWLGVQPDFD